VYGDQRLDELTSNYTLLIERSVWAPLVLAGLLGATFSSALSSIVGAPRILQALAEHKIMPGSSWFAVRASSGEPRNAMLFTGALVLAALMLRNLNAIAPLITMFFLVTYGMINVVVFIEQSLRLVSFRPLFRIPRPVSFIGAAGCIFAMFIVNPVFGIFALLVVLSLHAYLVKKHLKAPYGDVRSGLFAALAEWAAKKMETLAGPFEKTWKANLLVPVEISDQAERIYRLLRDVAYPKGFVRLLGLTGKRKEGELTETLPALAERFLDDGVFATWTVVRQLRPGPSDRLQAETKLEVRSRPRRRTEERGSTGTGPGLPEVRGRTGPDRSAPGEEDGGKPSATVYSMSKDLRHCVQGCGHQTVSATPDLLPRATETA
jgi:solute carrier family 12 (sodium/potassium/chloride transporter), member 2